MCKSQAEGGKRCLAHHPLTKFLTRFVKYKTGASDEIIKQAIRELNAEGKGLANVSTDKVEEWIARNEFAVLADPRIPEHERKVQLAQLENAKEHIQVGVEGNRFHVWRNLLSRVRKNLGRKIAVFAVAGALSFGLAACSAGVQGSPTNSPSPSFSVSASPSASTPVTPTSGIVVTNQSVTDQYGTYKKTALPSGSPLYKYNPSNVDSSATKLYSPSQITAAQKFVLDFVTTQALDSDALDNQANTSKWKNENKSDLYAPYASKLLAATKSGGSLGLIVQLKDSSNNTDPMLARDGRSRIDAESTTLDPITGINSSDGNKYITVTGKSNVKYRATKASIVKAELAINPDKTEAQLKKDHPELFTTDSKFTDITLEYTWSYTVTEVGSDWKIAGFSNTQEVTNYLS